MPPNIYSRLLRKRWLPAGRVAAALALVRPRIQRRSLLPRPRNARPLLRLQPRYATLKPGTVERGFDQGNTMAATPLTVTFYDLVLLSWLDRRQPATCAGRIGRPRDTGACRERSDHARRIAAGSPPRTRQTGSERE